MPNPNFRVPEVVDLGANMSTIDDVIRQMQIDEAEGATKLSPIEYARLRGIAPQKVYRALRLGKLVWDRCECGRRVVVVSDVDEYFGLGGTSDSTEAQGEDSN